VMRRQIRHLFRRLLLPLSGIASGRHSLCASTWAAILRADRRWASGQSATAVHCRPMAPRRSWQALRPNPPPPPGAGKNAAHPGASGAVA
jgi:hypothetical protein